MVEQTIKYDWDDSLWKYYSQHCPNVMNGGKSECNDGDCDCASDGETGCVFGICICVLEGHLAFNKIRCDDMNHPHILSNTSHHELQCPRTCEISSPLQNTCMSPSKKGDDGRCYCPDGSLVVPKFLKDRKLFLPTDHLATLELCSHQPNVTLLPTAGTPNVTLSPSVSTLSNMYIQYLISNLYFF